MGTSLFIFIFSSVFIVILGGGIPMFCISLCRNFFGFDPQTKFDEFVMDLGKIHSGLLIVCCLVLSIILSSLVYECWEERQEHPPEDRESPPRETLVDPDVDMSSPIHRTIVNATLE